MIRKRLQRWFETGDAGGLDHGAGLGSATFRHILLMGHGQVKHTMESGDAKRQSLYFVTQSGMVPWAPAMDNMSEQVTKMIEENDRQEKLKAIEAKAEPVETDKGDEVPETLERVSIPEPPDNPEAFR